MTDSLSRHQYVKLFLCVSEELAISSSYFVKALDFMKAVEGFALKPQEERPV